MKSGNSRVDGSGRLRLAKIRTHPGPTVQRKTVRIGCGARAAADQRAADQDANDQGQIAAA
jgi:hypothetical protein